MIRIVDNYDWVTEYEKQNNDLLIWIWIQNIRDIPKIIY